MKLIPYKVKATAKRLLSRIGLNCTWPHSFSQEGEDMILARCFEAKSSGVYVDVGAHHPIRFSNTYLFYLRGWRGVNIDAMPGSMEEFRRLRARDVNVETLVASKPGTLEYFQFNEPALNTCDPELAKKRDGLANYRLIGRKTIHSKTLAEILRRHLEAGVQIDFMSVDVEGLDLDVLQSNDWQEFRPKVIVTEDCSVSTIESALHAPTSAFLRGHGYSLFAKTVNTLFFRHETVDI